MNGLLRERKEGSGLRGAIAVNTDEGWGTEQRVGEQPVEMHSLWSPESLGQSLTSAVLI